ncbi:MAG: HAMP domain-containing histidine kinase [Oscillospiraceae bacterium]|jgi:signal transduction histidine kinase|nr:HAMP domain-containing histidine kinase [Oscillospiraceae bacterium]
MKNERKHKSQRRNPEVVINNISDKVHGASTRALGNLRFSIKLRIALAHVWMLFRALPFAALLFVVAAAFVVAPGMVRDRDAAILSAQTDTPPFTMDSGVFVAPFESEEDGDTEVFSSIVDAIGAAVPREMNIHIYNGWGFTLRRENMTFYATYVHGDMLLHFPLTSAIRIFYLFYAAFLIVWLSLLFGVLVRGQKKSRALLAPIGSIANTAQQLTESNLSMRINVAGTQNELRDLAMMVNAMLDRIESAYNRQKQFVSDASHELRTPIAVLQGYADLLARWGKDAPEVRDEAISAIQNETVSMKVLVENLLFLARHDKRTLKMEPHPFSLADLMNEVVKETELIAGDHHIDKSVIEDAALNADRTQIKQALRIFVDNALKYTLEGGVVSLSSAVAGTHCRISISDTGIGIAKEELPKVFDRFYRSDSARDLAGSGHGLGLSIARIIVSSHGGTINVRSKLKQGSTFTVSLPLNG